MLDFFSQKSQIAVQNITESMHKKIVVSPVQLSSSILQTRKIVLQIN